MRILRSNSVRAHTAVASSSGISRTIEQFIEDIPPVRPHVTRLTTYRGYLSRDAGRVSVPHILCRCHWPSAQPAFRLGPRALALAADLNKAKGLSMRKTCAVLHNCFELQLSPGGLSQTLDRLAAKVKPQYDALALVFCCVNDYT